MRKSRSDAPRRGAGFTLVEVLVAAALMGTVMVAAWFMFTAGHSASLRGIAASSLISGANRLEQQLMNDIVQMIPTTNAVRLDLSGTYVSFQTAKSGAAFSVYPSERTTTATTDTWKIHGEEVRYHLVLDRDGSFHPARNDHVFSDVRLRNWCFRFVSSSEESTGPMRLPTTPHPLPGELLGALELPKVSPRGPASIGPGPATTGPAATLGPGGSFDIMGLPPMRVTTAYLVLDYTLVDAERRGELKRSLLWDLDNLRALGTYASVFAMPPDMIALARPRPIPAKIEKIFDPDWELDPDVARTERDEEDFR